MKDRKIAETPEEKEAERLHLSLQDTGYWLEYYNVVNEKGDRLDFTFHQYLIDIYNDQSPNLVVTKAAQVGMSTLEILKNIRDAQIQKMDIIYTLPTDSDVTVFVGGKVNRILANNPDLMNLAKDKDSIEQKQISLSMLYFRGTWTKKSAIMITADRLVHDEKDSSKQDVIADYQARLQHSKYKQTHVFSHPSVLNNGVDAEWQLSDQKEWIITCTTCNFSQYLSWNTEDPKQMSIDLVHKIYICKKCGTELDKFERAKGKWKPRAGRANAKWSGYHISLMMVPDISAKDIIDKYNDAMEGRQTMDYFYNKVLGLPYAGSGNSVTEDMVRNLVTSEKNLWKGRLVIGVDSGVDLRYVVGNKQGLVSYGQMKYWEPDPAMGIELKDTIEYFLKKFPDSIMVIDQGGDIIGPRKLRAKYPGRVFLCHYGRDRKTMNLMRWGEKAEFGNVIVDRNRAIQMVIDHMREGRFKIYGRWEEWYEYWLHWSHIYRVGEIDSLGVRQYVWHRSDRDDWVHATVYWYIGLDKFGTQGFITNGNSELQPDPNSYIVNPDNTIGFNPHEMFGKQMPTDEEPWWAKNEEDEGEWR